MPGHAGDGQLQVTSLIALHAGVGSGMLCLVPCACDYGERIVSVSDDREILACFLPLAGYSGGSVG